MSIKRFTYPSRVFQEFKELEHYDFHSVIRFFEENEEDIEGLNFPEYFELLLHYANAVFELGGKSKFLPLADSILELSIQNNVQFNQGEDIYLKTLFQKADCLYRMHHYEAAGGVLRELIKLQPHNQTYISLYRRNLSRARPVYIKRISASGVFLYLFSVLLIMAEILFVDSLYEQYSTYCETIRWSLTGLAMFILLLGELLHFWQVRGKIRKFVMEARLRRKRKIGLDINVL